LLDFVRLQGIDSGPIYDTVATSLLAIDGPTTRASASS
jgi:hypothetical protein